jgi:hypothetical protein
VPRLVAVRVPFAIATRTAAPDGAVVDDVPVVFRIAASWAVCATFAPTAAPATIALPIAAATPIPTTIVNYCGIPVCAMPIVATICIVVKIPAAAPDVASMDSCVAPVSTVVLAIPAFAEFAMAAARAV